MTKVEAKKKKEKNTYTTKRKKIFTIIPVVIILIIIGFFYFIQNPTIAKAQLIIESGTVQVKHKGESWISAENGMILIQSDAVKTGNNSSATIILFESSIIRLDSNTEITFQEILQQLGETNIRIEQETGRTWNTITKISGIDNYEVQTPTTVASVRGTTFDVQCHVDKIHNITEGKPTVRVITTVRVINGTVNVSSIKNGTVLHSIEVHRNESVSVDPDVIDKPLSTVPFEKDEWIQQNQQKDEQHRKDVKDDLYQRIAPYISELQLRYNITYEELDVLIDGYLKGYYDLPPETPEWIRDIIELS